MSNLGKRTTSITSSVFIEEDEKMEIMKMRYLLSQGSADEIRKYLFPTYKSREFDVAKLTDSQINKHVKVLSTDKKNVLREVLQKSSEGTPQSLDLKSFSEQKTNYSAVDSDR